MLGLFNENISALVYVQYSLVKKDLSGDGCGPF